MYQAELWHEAYVVLGGGAAALAGLIIVAVSVRADQIMAMPHWRLRARNNTMSMISIMVASILVLLPQEPRVLGIELIVLNLSCAILLPGRVILYQFLHRTDASLYVPVLAALLYLLAAAGGVSLIAQWGGGMYLITAAYSMYMFLAPYNAYLLLLPHGPAAKA
jgi:hypothetical protein